MKNIYFAVQTHDKDTNKNYAYVIKAGENEDILSVLKRVPNIRIANIYTKKEAERITDFWNECFKKNGTYIFQ